jgi:hypothetical protein
MDTRANLFLQVNVIGAISHIKMAAITRRWIRHLTITLGSRLIGNFIGQSGKVKPIWGRGAFLSHVSKKWHSSIQRTSL